MLSRFFTAFSFALALVVQISCSSGSNSTSSESANQTQPLVNGVRLFSNYRPGKIVQYDASGAISRTITITFDEATRTQTETFTVGSSETFLPGTETTRFDSQGRLAETFLNLVSTDTDNNPTEIDITNRWTFQAQQPLTYEFGPADSPTYRINYSIDESGRLNRAEYISLNGTPYSPTWERTYNESGWVDIVSDEANTETITVAIDSAGRVQSRENFNNNKPNEVFTITYQYDDLGRMISFESREFDGSIFQKTELSEFIQTDQAYHLDQEAFITFRSAF